jgi:hypothetical protein
VTAPRTLARAGTGDSVVIGLGSMIGRGPEQPPPVADTIGVA